VDFTAAFWARGLAASEMTLCSVWFHLALPFSLFIDFTPLLHVRHRTAIAVYTPAGRGTHSRVLITVKVPLLSIFSFFVALPFSKTAL
jgi:hypothetical protein